MHKKEVYWSLSVKQLFSTLQTSEQGLSTTIATQRQQKYGWNELPGKEERHALRILLSQFKNPLILILVTAVVIAYVLGERINALVILLMILLNVILAFFQEYRAQRTVRELKKYVSYTAKVLRDNQIVEINTSQLVPGDVIYLNIGDLIPADVRLLQEDGLSADESALTGESVPVRKKIGVLSADFVLPQQLTNMLFMGTSVASGSAHAVVVATGASTFFGHTASYLKRKEPEADFQKSIRHFGNFLVKIIIIMTLFIFLANAVLGKGYLTSFMFALALAVGITPEILPVIMTVTLSQGAAQMAKEKVIIKRLASVEDLGNIDTLCCDKTGTLTEGQLRLHQYVNPEGIKNSRLVLLGLLCSSGRDRRTAENPIDRSLWESLVGRTLLSQMRKYTVVDYNEFDYERRRVSVVVKHQNRLMLTVKGAPESILQASSFVQLQRRTALSNSLRRTMLERVRGYEAQGYKVIAVAEKQVNKKNCTVADERTLTFCGLLLFVDPPKKSAKEALLRLQQLGVAVKILSGDSPMVTQRVCTQVSLDIAKNKVWVGDELDRLTPSQFEDVIQKYNVFARVSPEQKYRIVASLNKEGHIVGFLGDGVNDAPALKAADVGISVNTGTGIAKEAADIVLLTKSLHVIIDGIRQGRKIFSNITKYILNTISANYGNMFTIAISSVFLKFIPLLPSQILLNNFISDIPNLAIATDNVDEELLHRPRRWNFKRISNFMVYFGILSSVFDLLLIFALLLVFKVTPDTFRTSWFVMSAISEIIILFSLRTHLPFFRSKPSMWLVLVSVFCLVVSLSLPFLFFGQQFFQFVPLSAALLGLIAVVLVLYFAVVELGKSYFYKKFAE